MSEGGDTGGEGHANTAGVVASLLLATFGLGERPRTVAAFAGESGSGKTTTAIGVARQLAAAGLASRVLHQDDYFHRAPRANHAHRLCGLAAVGPHEVDLALLQSHVDAFRAGEQAITVPRVDHAADRFLTERLDCSDTRVLLVEGTYVLDLAGLDVRVFLAATHEDTRERRRQRNRDVDAPVMDEILAIEHAIIVRQAGRAQIVIDRDWSVRVVGARRAESTP